METSAAHTEYVAKQEFEWQRWAVAYIRLRNLTNYFLDGLIDRQMLFSAIDTLELALGNEIDVQPETLSVILDVLKKSYPDNPVISPAEG